MANNTSCPVCRQPLEGASPSPAAPSGQVLRRDMYEDELGFRLGGLNRMYPNIVSQAMMTHARSAVQHGQVINWDSVRQVLTFCNVFCKLCILGKSCSGDLRRLFRRSTRRRKSHYPCATRGLHGVRLATALLLWWLLARRRRGWWELVKASDVDVFCVIV